MAYDVVDVNELEGEGPGGMVRKARRATGATAFGFNYFTFPPNQEGREHDHSENGHEEVYFTVKGSGTMTIDGSDVEMKPGRFIRVDPGSTRMPTSGPEGLEFVTFGGPQQGPYEPPSWG
jgi:mannose-6-phosphate isomerase-like protein (cupin superfamily)